MKTSKIKSIVVLGINLHICTDKDGYITIESDGYLLDTITPLLRKIYELRTDNDREMEIND